MLNIIVVLSILVVCSSTTGTTATPAPCPPLPTNDTSSPDDLLLARYIFELAQNRAPNCEAGGDFLPRWNASYIRLTVPHWCVTKESDTDTVTTINATYSYIQCEGEPGAGALTNSTINFRIKDCGSGSGIGGVLSQPFALIEANITDMPPDFQCPTNYTTHERDYGDINFTPEWEFAHLAENAFKYNLSVLYPNLVNYSSYLSTTLKRACINEQTGEYLGYAELRAEYINNDTVLTFVPVYVHGKLLQGGGNPLPLPPFWSSLDARRQCPWPEILNTSASGYDGNFTFLAQSPSQPPRQEEQGSSAPLVEALQCIDAYGIETVVQADGTAYTVAKQVWNRLNDTTTRPLAIVYPRDEPGVQATVLCCSSNNVSVVPRAGGHSYEGYSVQDNTITIDLRHLNTTKIIQNNTLVLVGGGTRLGPLYYTATTGTSSTKTIAAGTCPPVSVGGLVPGGGIGYVTRKYGLACDLLHYIRMVDAHGSLIEANNETNSDLFWASCGGGGGNFGIITQYALRLVDLPSPNVTQIDIAIPKGGAEFMMYLQELMATGSVDRSLALVAFPGENGAQSVSVSGMYLGPGDEALSALNASGLGSETLVQKTNTTSIKLSTEEMPFLEFVTVQSYLDSVKTPSDLLNVDAFHSGRTFFKYKSFFVLPSSPLPKSTYELLANWTSAIAQVVLQAGDTEGFSDVDITILKGAVADRSSNATAFPYRDALLLVQYGMEWTWENMTSTYEGYIQELSNQLVSVAEIGEAPPAYINYVDVQAPLQTFYGQNYDRLIDIKRQYDGGDYFHSPMSIPLAYSNNSGGGDVPSSSVPSSVAQYWYAVCVALFITTIHH